MIKLLLSLPQLVEDAHEISSHCAADAPVIHFENLLLCRDDQRVIHPNLPKLVLNHGDAQSVLPPKDVVDKRRFAGTKKAGEDTAARPFAIFLGMLA